MKKILVIGAGLVAKPLVEYLLAVKDFEVTVAEKEVSRARALTKSRESSSAIALDVTENEKLASLIKQTDVVVSLVPYTFHAAIARICITEKKHLVTTSYVSPEMRSLDEEAKKAGLILLNEIGLDPGIDHMSAMRIIHGVERAGGKVTSFRSYCGGLPAPEANDNPFGYKFSWSPRGVILAGRNSARYLKDGEVIDVPSTDLFGHTWEVEIESVGSLEAYPNRDSIPYIETYGLEGIGTMFRGTLRYPGWCPAWKYLSASGYVNDDEKSLAGTTYKEYTESVTGPNEPEPRVREMIEWLGLYSDEEIGLEKGTGIDVLEKILLEKLVYAEGERDMIVLTHEFEAEYPDRKCNITSTMIDYGVPGGDSAMSRTVGLPAAIAAKMIAQGRIELTGVRIPVNPEIYEPVLYELEKLGIGCEEKEV